MPKKSINNSNLTSNFVLRLPAETHKALKEAAGEVGLSLNEICKRILEANLHNAIPPADVAAVVQRSRAFFEDRVVGVIMYGSFARGEATEESDIDLLVVLDPDVAISRKLYRDWDEANKNFASRLQINFVHLPTDNALSSLWCEIALDGIVLFEKSWRLSRVLSKVRHKIMAGHAKRKVAHGQAYWDFGDEAS